MLFSSLIQAALQQGRFAAQVSLIFTLVGCRGEEIKVYRVAKERPETPAVANPHDGISQGDQRGVASAVSAPGKPAWTVPPSWTEELPTQMLQAKFSVTDQDTRAAITVSSFPGDVGGLLANMNRWRGQVGLPPIAETELAQAVRQLATQAGNASLVDLTGTDGMTGRTARLICVVLPHAGQTWFFKMLGDEQVVAREKEFFLKFVQSVTYPNAL